MGVRTGADLEAWPSLPFEAWSETCATLHRWTQIVGKVRLTQSPWVNHGWHVTLYVTATGLTTSSIRYGNRTFQIDFDFVKHRLALHSSDGGTAGFALAPQSVATFYPVAPVKPGAAFYSTDFREFVLPHDVVRQSTSPDSTLLDFLQTTYEAAANLAKWDRTSLERGRDPKSAP